MVSLEVISVRNSKKPIEDLEVLFNKLKNDKNFITERDKYFKSWIGVPTRFIKLHNLTNHIGGAQIWSRLCLMQMEELTRFIMQQFIVY